MSPKSRKLKDLLISLIVVLCVYTGYNSVTSKPETISKKELSPDVVSTSFVIYEKNTVKFIPYDVIMYNYVEKVGYDEISWSRYAYVQYATDWNYLCGAIMNFVSLRSFNSMVDFVLLVSDNVKIDYETKEGKLFRQQASELDIKVRIVELLKIKSDSTTWNKSFTKFNLFRLTEYRRVIYIDSDSRVLKKMDELFFLPDCMIAMPPLYELNYEAYEEKHYDIPEDFKLLDEQERQLKYHKIYESVSADDGLDTYLARIYNRLPELSITENFKFENQLMVIRPSLQVYENLMELANKKKGDEYDMDIINKYFNLDRITNRQFSEAEQYRNIIPEVLVLPHQNYGFLSGEFRYNTHDIMLADPQDLPYVVSNKLSKLDLAYWSFQQWDLNEIFEDRIKLIHFSDFPVPKPWIEQTLPNDYVKSKILCEDDPKRLQEYENYNAQQNDEKDYMMPTFVVDCDLANIWNSLYEDYVEDRLNICGLPLVSN